jgi:hypothetical protein
MRPWPFPASHPPSQPPPPNPRTPPPPRSALLRRVERLRRRGFASPPPHSLPSLTSALAPPSGHTSSTAGSKRRGGPVRSIPARRRRGRARDSPLRHEPLLRSLSPTPARSVVYTPWYGTLQRPSPSVLSLVSRLMADRSSYALLRRLLAAPPR